MKKITAFVFTCAMITTLSACGGTKKKSKCSSCPSRTETVQVTEQPTTKAISDKEEYSF